MSLKKSLQASLIFASYFNRYSTLGLREQYFTRLYSIWECGTAMRKKRTSGRVFWRLRDEPKELLGRRLGEGRHFVKIHLLGGWFLEDCVIYNQVLFWGKVHPWWNSLFIFVHNRPFPVILPNLNLLRTLDLYSLWILVQNLRKCRTSWNYNNT